MGRPKKKTVKVSGKQFESAIEALGGDRKTVAQYLNVSLSTLVKWKANGEVPVGQWELMQDVERFRESGDVKIAYNDLLDRATEKFGIKALEQHSLEELVSEIESRGWSVNLTLSPENKSD